MIFCFVLVHLENFFNSLNLDLIYLESTLLEERNFCQANSIFTEFFHKYLNLISSYLIMISIHATNLLKKLLQYL